MVHNWSMNDGNMPTITILWGTCAHLNVQSFANVFADESES